MLALTASETDASNKSYYGEQKLHYLAANGSLDCLVPLPKVSLPPSPQCPRHKDAMETARKIINLVDAICIGLQAIHSCTTAVWFAWMN